MAFRYKDEVPYRCDCDAEDDDDCICGDRDAEYEGEWICRRPGNEETWNPNYNSDYFDIDEVDEYGDEEGAESAHHYDDSVDYDREDTDGYE